MLATHNFNLPTVYHVNNTGMNALQGLSPENLNEVRDRSLSFNPSLSRESLISFTKSSISYHERMEQNNGMDVDEIDQSNNNSSPGLFYENTQKKNLYLSKTAETQTNTRTSHADLTVNTCPQHDSGNHPTLTPPHSSTSHNNESVFINIQLPYDLNALTNPEIWNGSFHPISLHGFIEYIASDAKSIKDSLKFMAKYISNKQVKPAKANDLKDFNGIGNVVWNFISSVYESNWNVLYNDNKSNTLRRKIAAKFTPKIQSALQRPSKESAKSTPASIERIPLLIPAKSQKEVNIISKYFKNKQPEVQTPGKTKSYAQVSKQTTSTSDVIKIKEIFLSIGAKKINRINNIVKRAPKAKPHINMTTKRPLHKQVIIPMGNENITKFMNNSAIHITNLNRNLKNAKSEALVDFIYSDPVGITVVTNKVSLPSDLLIIENYVKNSESSLPMMLNSSLSRIKSSTMLLSPLSQELLKSFPS